MITTHHDFSLNGVTAKLNDKTEVQTFRIDYGDFCDITLYGESLHRLRVALDTLDDINTDKKWK